MFTDKLHQEIVWHYFLRTVTAHIFWWLGSVLSFIGWYTIVRVAIIVHTLGLVDTAFISSKQKRRGQSDFSLQKGSRKIQFQNLSSRIVFLLGCSYPITGFMVIECWESILFGVGHERMLPPTLHVTWVYRWYYVLPSLSWLVWIKSSPVSSDDFEKE